MTTEITSTGVKFKSVDVEQPRPVVSVNGTIPDDFGNIAIAANAVGTYIDQGYFGATDYMFKDSNWWGGEQVYNYSSGNSLANITLVDALVKGSVINLISPDSDYFFVSNIDRVGKLITLRRGVFYDRGNSNLTVKDSENDTFSGITLTHVSSIAPQGCTNAWLKVVTNSNNSNKPSINQTLNGVDDLPMDLSHIPSTATHILFRVASSTTGNLIIYNRENFDTRPAGAPLLESEKVHQIDVENSGLQNSYGEFWVPNNSYFRFWLSGSGKFNLYPVAYSESPTVNTNGSVQDPLGFQKQIDDLKNKVDGLSFKPYINENHGLSLVYDDSDPLNIRIPETSDTLVSSQIHTFAVHFGYSKQFSGYTNSNYIYDLENQNPSVLPNWASGEYWISSRHSGDSSSKIQGVQGHEFLFSNNRIKLSNPQVDGIEFSGSSVWEITQNGVGINHDVKLRFYIESGLSGSPVNNDIYEMNIVETDPLSIGATKSYLRLGGFAARNTPFTSNNANVINFDWNSIDSALDIGCRVVPALVISTGSLDTTTPQNIDIKIYSFQMSINFIYGS